jgi:hypothetical protein
MPRFRVLNYFHERIPYRAVRAGRSAVRGGAREQRRITADDILHAVGTADETDRTLVHQSALLNSVVMPAVEQAERTFSTALARINIEELARSAASLTTQGAD